MTRGTCSLSWHIYRLISTLLLLTVSGCANPLNLVTYERYLTRGREAEKGGDIGIAEQAYYRALVNADIGFLGPEYRATAAYNLARMKRVVCKPGEAEQLFRLALEAGEKASSPPERMGPLLFELARFYYEHGRYAEAIVLFERGFPIVDKLGVERTHPEQLAYHLNFYADALRKVNRPGEAAGVEARLKALPGQFVADVGQRSVTSIAVGRDPTGIGVGAGAVWVAQMLDNAVIRIHPDSNRVIGEPIPVGKQPAGLAIGEGAVWVANMGDATVSRIDVRTNRPVATIPVGGSPRMLATGFGSVWVGNGESDVVSRIESRTNEVVARIRTGRSPHGLAVGEDAVWVANSEDGTVVRIDPKNNQLVGTPIRTGRLQGMVVGEGAVWGAGIADNVVIRIDPLVNEVVARIPVGRQPSSVATGKGAVWVTNTKDGTVSRIDPRTNQVVGRIDVALEPVWIAVGEGTVWVGNRCSETVSRLDLSMSP